MNETNTPTLPRDTVSVPREGTLRSAVWRLRRTLESADAGTLSALRRMAPEAPPLAFYRATVDLLDEGLPEAGPLRAERERQWAVIAQCMAQALDLLGSARLGDAMAGAGVAERRLAQLLDARGNAVADILRTVVHQLVQRGQAFDPVDVAQLVLFETGDRAADIRRGIARNYYRHETK